MAHIHLSWELGGGLGHAGRLKALAIALRARGHQVTMSLRDMVTTRPMLAGQDIALFQAPLFLHNTVGLPPPASLADILLRCGYLDASALGGLVDGWRALFRQLRPDLVVADYAPTAILAARSLGLRSASVGNGFFSPPACRALPPIRDRDGVPAARLQEAEAHVLRIANAVLAASGGERGPAAPFTLGADLLLGDAPMLCTWPALDHYARAALQDLRWFGPIFPQQDGAAPPWPQGGGRKVFAYLKAGHPDHVALLQALADEACPTLVYLPEVAGGMAPPVVADTLIYLRGPAPLAPVLAEADLCICHGGDATVAQALLAAVPVLLLPMQAEQALLARRVEHNGAGINAALRAAPVDWRALLRQLLDQAQYRQAARRFAARHRAHDPQAMLEQLALALEHEAGVR